MALEYSNQKNQFSSDLNEYFARTHNVKMNDEEDIIDECAQINPAIKRETYRLAYDTFLLAIGNRVREGEGINTRLLHAMPTIKGIIKGKDGSMGKDNYVEYNMQETEVFKENYRFIELRKTESVENLPNITAVKDTESGTVDTKITRNGGVELVGYKQNVMAAATPDNQEGVFIINVSDGKETRINKLTVNFPKQIVFTAPEDLVEGECYIEIRTYAISGSAPGKVLKVGRFRNKLTIVSKQ